MVVPTTFDIADNFAFPLETATETIAIVARRGAGKTYTARKLAEGLLLAEIPTVIVDPIGVCWGLRSSANGKEAGLPIVILGGEHADAPLPEDSGELVADMVNQHRMSCVLDMSLMRKGATHRFFTDFAEHLYHIQREAVHLIVDEADEFAPQRPMPNEARMLGAMEDLVRRGRARGIGMTMITQRPSVINKNVLTQCEILIALQMSHNLDLKAVDEWVKLHGTDEERERFLASVPGLQKGEAWIWSPSFLKCFTRVKVAKCRTFDSSATPAAGAKKVTPKQRAAVNLDLLRSQMAEQIAAAEKDDPKRLHARIAELEAQIRSSSAPAFEMGKAFAAFAGGVRETIALLGEKIDEVSDLAAARLLTIERYQEDVLAGHLKACAPGHGKSQLVVPKSVSGPTVKNGQKYSSDYSGPRVPAAALGEPVDGIKLDWDRGANQPIPLPRSEAPGVLNIPKAQRQILTALATHGPKNRTQTAVLSRYSADGGSFRSALGALRSAAYVADRNGLIEITPEGLAALGPYEKLPTGRALREWWMSNLPLAQRTILGVVLDHWPRVMSKEEIAERSNYSADGGSFRSAMGRLRTLELIVNGTEPNPELVAK